MSHSADKVAVGGADRLFVLGENAHVSAETGAAGGCGDNRAGFDEYFKQTFSHGLKVYGLCAGNDDAANVFGNLAAFEDSRRCPEVFESAVGAGTDNGLVNFYFLLPIFVLLLLIMFVFL